MVHVIEDRLKDAAMDADREKALKDVIVATAKDKGKAAKATEKRAQASEKARMLAKQKLTKMDIKLGGTELKLVEVKSLNLAQADELPTKRRPLKLLKRNGITRDLQMPKTPWNQLSIKHKGMGSRKVGWPLYKP